MWIGEMALIKTLAFITITLWLNQYLKRCLAKNTFKRKLHVVHSRELITNNETLSCRHILNHFIEIFLVVTRSFSFEWCKRSGAYRFLTNLFFPFSNFCPLQPFLGTPKPLNPKSTLPWLLAECIFLPGEQESRAVARFFPPGVSLSIAPICFDLTTSGWLFSPVVEKKFPRISQQPPRFSLFLKYCWEYKLSAALVATNKANNFSSR